MPGLSVARHRLAPFLLQAPSVTALLLWSIVPLVMTLWFSFRRYNLLEPNQTGFAHLENYRYLLGDPSLGSAILNTFLLVGWVLVITVGLGTLLAILYDQDFFGRSVTRVILRMSSQTSARLVRPKSGIPCEAFATPAPER